MKEQEEEQSAAHIPCLTKPSPVKVGSNTLMEAQFAHMFVVRSRYACEMASDAMGYGHTDEGLAGYEIQRISSRATAT